ncbi:hypothetical protein M413DRAFT_267830 [Hebeloma cylindrosporum]|uniref:Uncharacterized protein n=1 Tax=Hebeloma cylindrosporum TaxID=76867 RepID=A0A0C2YB03_HEBCY|nr:hypothetical protein M413DRAFT_267830 [Hebeloma cylindrosporum h7]
MYPICSQIFTYIFVYCIHKFFFVSTKCSHDGIRREPYLVDGPAVILHRPPPIDTPLNPLSPPLFFLRPAFFSVYKKKRELGNVLHLGGSFSHRQTTQLVPQHQPTPSHITRLALLPAFLLVPWSAFKLHQQQPPPFFPAPTAASDVFSSSSPSPLKTKGSNVKP